MGFFGSGKRRKSKLQQQGEQFAAIDAAAAAEEEKANEREKAIEEEEEEEEEERKAAYPKCLLEHEEVDDYEEQRRRERLRERKTLHQQRRRKTKRASEVESGLLEQSQEEHRRIAWLNKQRLIEMNMFDFKTDGTAVNESPIIKGYRLAPISAPNDVTKISPVYFNSEYVSYSNHVQVDCRLRAFGNQNAFYDLDRFKHTIKECLLELIPDDAIGYEGMHLSSFEEVDDKDIKSKLTARLVRKIKKAYKNDELDTPVNSELQIHLENLKLGLSSFSLSVKVDSLHRLFQLRGVKPDYYVPNQDQQLSQLQPVADVTFDILRRDQEVARQVAKRLGVAIGTGELSRLFNFKLHSEAANQRVSFSLVHVPQVATSSAVEDRRLPNDTPRGRASDARATAMAASAVVSQHRLHWRRRGADGGFECDPFDACPSRPRYEAVQFVHPTFLNRAPQHMPVFAGRYEATLVRQPLGNHCGVVHPAASSIPPSVVGDSQHALVSTELCLYADTAHRGLDHRLDVTTCHPLFAGQLAVPVSPQQHQHRHPATTSYREVAPLLHGGSRIHSPACFGYRETVAPLPPTRLAETTHVAAVGYSLSQKDLGRVRGACEVVSPAFFGYDLVLGARHSGAAQSHKAIEQKTQKLIKATFESSGVCPICFGHFAFDGCPGCFEVQRQDHGREEPRNTVIIQMSKKQSRQFRQSQSVVKGKGIHALKSRQLDDAAEGKMHSSEAIARCRRSAVYVVLYIKKLPFGDVVKVTMDAGDTVRYLHYLYRSNAAQQLGNQKHVTLLLPTSRGVFVLDESIRLESDLACRTQVGLCQLRQFGALRSGAVCLFQVENTRSPKVDSMLRSFYLQNVPILPEPAVDSAHSTRIKKDSGITSLARHNLARERRQQRDLTHISLPVCDILDAYTLRPPMDLGADPLQPLLLSYHQHIYEIQQNLRSAELAKKLQDRRDKLKQEVQSKIAYKRHKAGLPPVQFDQVQQPRRPRMNPVPMLALYKLKLHQAKESEEAKQNSPHQSPKAAVRHDRYSSPLDRLTDRLTNRDGQSSRSLNSVTSNLNQLTSRSQQKAKEKLQAVVSTARSQLMTERTEKLKASIKSRKDKFRKNATDMLDRYR